MKILKLLKKEVIVSPLFIIIACAVSMTNSIDTNASDLPICNKQHGFNPSPDVCTREASAKLPTCNKQHGFNPSPNVCTREADSLSEGKDIEGCEGGTLSPDGSQITCPNGTVYKEDRSTSQIHRFSTKIEEKDFAPRKSGPSAFAE